MANRWSRLGGCGALALASAIMPGTVHAQFAGTPTVNTGTVEIADQGRVVLIGSEFADITWTTQDAAAGPAIDFLPAGNAVAYWDGGESGDFTVLNRVRSFAGNGPDNRPVAFNGGVASFVGEEIGGTVWFYSPNGILIGPDAYFDVGNLLLSTGDIVPQAGGNVAIRGAEGATPRIVNDGLLNARGYVALVAPRLSQTAGGQIRAGGTAAFVGAQSATLTISESLFDIRVDVGAAAGGSDNVVIDHDGETLASGFAGNTGPHNVYMVAVPRDDAIVLALGGTIQVLDVSMDGGALVISGGGNIIDGQIVPGTGGGVADVSFAADTNGDFNPYLSDGAMIVGASGDIALGEGAQLQTRDVLLLNAGGDVRLGGGSGVVAGSAVDILADGSVTLEADSQLAASNAISVDAGQNIGIAGQVLVAGGGGESLIALSADGRIDVATPTGSVRVQDTAGAPAGSISLRAADILVADDATRQLVLAAGTPEEREGLLEANSGAQTPEGSISADLVDVTVSQSLFVQNTGSAIAFAGLNGNSIAIRRATGTTPEVLVFGRGVDEAGTVISDYRLRELAVNPGDSFAPGSSINNCLLALPSCLGLPPETVRPPIDQIIDPVAVTGRTPMPTLTFEFSEIGSLDAGDLGVLDDPVTGTGDTALWLRPPGCLDEEVDQCS